MGSAFVACTDNIDYKTIQNYCTSPINRALNRTPINSFRINRPVLIGPLLQSHFYIRRFKLGRRSQIVPIPNIRTPNSSFGARVETKGVSAKYRAPTNDKTPLRNIQTPKNKELGTRGKSKPCLRQI